MPFRDSRLRVPFRWMPLLPFVCCPLLLAAACNDTRPVVADRGKAGMASGGSHAGSGGAAPDAVAPLELPGLARWDWAGVIGTGQSLSVGAQAQDITSTTQPYENLKLSLGALVVPPFDPASAELSMVPLVEPIRPTATTYPSAYPKNIYGETPHTAMASQITSMVQAARAGAGYVGVHTVVGENGQGMPFLRKGATETVVGATSTGRAFAATVFEVSAIERLATAAGKTYGVGAIVMTHGESDAGNANYEAELTQLWSDYNQDLSAITGQTTSIPLLVSQQQSVPFTAGAIDTASASTLAAWHGGVSHPGDIICSGPKYQYPYAADGVHLVRLGYQLLGEKYGEIYFEKLVLGRDWQPLQPTTVERAGTKVTIHYHVPVAPMVWDEVLPAPHQAGLPEWQSGKGFELRSGAERLAITGVAIVGDTVELTAAAAVPAGAIVGYAVTSDGTPMPGGTRRWGQLRDSDAAVGATTAMAQPNYGVSFELAVP